jgi:arylsulfatase A
MIAHLDAKVGELLAKLDALRIRDKTLIVFTADNGGAWQSNNGGLKGAKTDLHEGGIRVPFLVSWPGHVQARSVQNSMAGAVDLLPTLCAAAGVDVPAREVNGINLLPHLTRGASIANRKPLLFAQQLYKKMQSYQAKPMPYATNVVMDGQWKLLLNGDNPTELFNIDNDKFETRNLLNDSARKGVVDAMVSKMRAALSEPRDRSWQTCDSFSHERKEAKCKQNRCKWSKGKLCTGSYKGLNSLAFSP